MHGPVDEPQYTIELSGRMYHPATQYSLGERRIRVHMLEASAVHLLNIPIDLGKGEGQLQSLDLVMMQSELDWLACILKRHRQTVYAQVVTAIPVCPCKLARASAVQLAAEGCDWDLT